MSECIHMFERSTYCGCHVCYLCNQHAHVNQQGEVTQTLVRCYCGWAESGGNGIEELQELGENVEDDY